MHSEDTVNGDRLDHLLARARAGDDGAYRLFLGKAAERLRNELRRKVAGDSELEDIVQECLIAIHRKRHTIDPDRPVTPWLYAIGNYKLIDHWRKRGRSKLVYAEADAPVAAPSSAKIDVATLLGKLPKAQADAVRMVHLDGMSGAEASEAAGVGLSAIKLRVHRGMRRLMAMVDET